MPRPMGRENGSNLGRAQNSTPAAGRRLLPATAMRAQFLAGASISPYSRRQPACGAVTPLHRLLTLGEVSFSDAAGQDVPAVSRRPKRIAFLCLLTAGAVRLHRDRALGLLWPELDAEHARHSLRQLLSDLRGILPGGAIEVLPGGDIRANPDALWCDARALSEAWGSGDHARVRELYRGDYLLGYHGDPASSAFEDWVEEVRKKLRAIAFDSTWKSALAEAETGDPMQAAQLAVEAVQLQPYAEVALRHAVRLLDRLGDRGRAIEVFEFHRKRLRADLDLVPSRHTETLLRALRLGMRLPSEPELVQRASSPDPSARPP